MRSMWSVRLAAASAIAMAAGAPLYTIGAQQTETGPKVGDMAPDFMLTGATRYGILRDPVKLSDYRGNVVVLAFFFKARTKG
jgi:peroxiredoxin Q/BCP